MTDDLALFDFALPEQHIATSPARPRESARLLHVIPPREQASEKTQPILHNHHIADLPGLLREGDLLIANNTEVIRAKIEARRAGHADRTQDIARSAKISITLDRILPGGAWHVLARNARKLHAGDTLFFECRNHGKIEDHKTGDHQAEPEFDPVTARVLTNEGDGAARLEFSAEGAAFDAFLERCGVLALPPYIARPHGPTGQDELDYQTIFSRFRGAVAAPTAGLHFTPALLKQLARRGIAQKSLTLHVGAGTFLPVRETIATHKMHPEWGRIDAETAEAINTTRARGGRVIAVGTTSLRLLETAAAPDGTMRPWAGETDIFIRPGYRFQAVDGLMTNFHLPRSTLFMLVCAFSGTTTMRTAYHHAIAQGMRFYSYGDACLLERAL